MKALAIDLGASSGRVLSVFLDDVLRVEEVHRFATPTIDEGGFERWDARALVAGVQSGIAKAGSVDSIGIDSWGVDFGLLDENNRLVANPIRYRDKSHLRGAE